jgi:hypothetical protein
MSLKIISPRTPITIVEHSLNFDSLLHPGSGFSFDCDEHGAVKPFEFAVGAQSYQDALAGVGTEFDAPYVHTSSRRWVEAAVAECTCGKHICLHSAHENTCTCGRVYNMSGQELIPNYGRAECVRDGWAYDEADY